MEAAGETLSSGARLGRWGHLPLHDLFGLDRQRVYGLTTTKSGRQVTGACMGGLPGP